MKHYRQGSRPNTLFQLLETSSHVVDMSQTRSTLAPFSRRLHGGTGRIGTRLGNRVGDHGHASDEDVVANIDMTHQPYATGEHAMLADLGAAGYAYAGRHGGVIANLYVVGNLDLVIELHAITDHGIGQSPAINSRIDADFHIVADQYAADLGNLVPNTFRIGKTEAFTTNHRTRLNDHPLPDTHVVVKGHTGRQPAISTDFTARTDKAVSA